MRIIQFMIFIVIMFCLQAVIFPIIPFVGDKIDLFFIIIAAMAFILDENQSILLSLGFGFLLDLFIPGYFVNMIIYGGLAVAINLFKSNIRSENLPDIIPWLLLIFPFFAIFKTIVLSVFIGRSIGWISILTNIFVGSFINILIAIMILPMIQFIINSVFSPDTYSTGKRDFSRY